MEFQLKKNVTKAIENNYSSLQPILRGIGAATKTQPTYIYTNIYFFSTGPFRICDIK